MTTIPASLADVTPDWMAEVTGLPVTGLTAEQFGVGIGVSSALYRLSLDVVGGPATVVLKMPALDPAAVFTSTMLRMYLREVGFFRELVSWSPIRVAG